MPREKNKYHYIYKITNLKNNKYYIGMHSTSNLDDGYLGSGDRIRNSIRYHGKDNHVKEILEYLPDRISLIAKEKEIVNEDLLKDPLCMNIIIGGNGGWTLEQQQKGGKISLTKQWKLSEYREKSIEKISIRSKELWKNEDFRKKCSKNLDYTGKKHSEETKEKIGKSNSLLQKGEKNSQFGTSWITNGIENKKININTEIPIGWKKGRIITK